MLRSIAVVIILLSAGSAQAVPYCDNDGRCRDVAPSSSRVHTARGGGVVGHRPAGCPRRWCGCGASLRVFGKIIPRLNLAANWLAFPRTAPAPNMAAARRGHVFVLEHHIQGNTWWVYDANSGGGKARMHARSIRGFTIVNPRAA
jgi:hypothetical protein